MSHSFLAGDVLGTVLPPILGILLCIVVYGCVVGAWVMAVKVSASWWCLATA